jgi:WD40 repeat protein
MVPRNRSRDPNSGQAGFLIRPHGASVICSTVRLWDPNTGAETARLEGHSNAVTALCALPDGVGVAALASGDILSLDFPNEHNRDLSAHALPFVEPVIEFSRARMHAGQR